ncbi:M48 family metalloprotease [Parvibaculum sp.]|uniref:M48 family metalloprotease n=1 Tax=Parvibaculum sp. TaxID=2024848 RepID=UPI001D5E0C4F|nr:M48 family metalloprotease [Parvibaculum sp.]MBX3491108.1 M48 family metallopeptidase [Parvibaculum sp.]MCW5728928.1 M48 family metallopeptidase [Parvibaculum sp.]
MRSKSPFGPLLALCAALAIGAANTAAAQGIAIVSDAETENMLRDYADPLLKVAGLDPAAVKIHLVNDRRLNAFVAEGQQMFYHTGLITIVDSPGELIGVMAHEIGHMAGGHLVQRREHMATLQVPMIASMILGVGAIAAGQGDAGMALILGGQHLAQRGFFAYTREQEASADQAGASYLQRAGLSGQGMLDLFASMRDQEMLSEERQDPFARSHPMSAARYNALEERVKASPYFERELPPEEIHRFKMVQAKLHGFLDEPNIVFNRYPASDKSDYARYARSVAYHRTGALSEALTEIDPLLESDPKNPYIHEVKGQILFESGKIEEAVTSYRQSVDLKPDDAQLHLGLGRALLGRDGEENARAAIPHLLTGTRGASQPFGYYQLSIAYGRLNQIGMAELATAQYYNALGRVKEAKMHAGRAAKNLPQGSPEWLRAQDIAIQADPQRG